MKIKEILAPLVGSTAQNVYTWYKPGQVPISLISAPINHVKNQIKNAVDQS